MTPIPYRILVIDDDTASLQSINNALSALGKYETHGINHGEAAFEHLETSPRLPDLIVLDMDMPQMSGLEFLAGLKMDGSWGDIPVIMLTDENSSAVEQGFEMGAVDWVPQNAISTQLALRIGHNIKEHRAHRKAIDKIIATHERNSALIGEISQQIRAHVSDIGKHWDFFYAKFRESSDICNTEMREEMPMLLQLLQSDMGRLQRILEEI